MPLVAKLLPLGLMTCLAAQAVAADIVARAPTGVTPEAERMLAEAAEPWRVKLGSGQSAEAYAKALCGNLSSTYKALLAEANRSSAQPGRAVVPACFATHFDVEIPVRSGEGLRAVAWRHVGVDGPKTLGAIVKANPGIGASVGLMSMGNARPLNTDTVTLPFKTEAVVYSLKPGFEAQAVSNQLKSALGIEAIPALASAVAPSNEFTLEADVVPGSGKAVPCTSALAAKYASWPYALTEVTTALARLDAKRGPSIGPADPAVVAVVDNGMDGIFAPQFPFADFDVNVAEYSNPGGNADGNAYVGDVVGTNIYVGGNPVAYPAAEKPWHGTIMASLALGGQEYRTWQAANHPVRRVKVRAVSLVEAENRATENGNKMFYAMPTAGLEKALQYIAGGKAKTVNLSVSTPNRLHSVENAVLGNYDLLLIVASGNGAYDLNKVYRYPAATGHLTRAQAGRVIAVASHDKRGCLSSFSGRGKEIVDLAAPGEQIQAMGFGGQLMTSEGTSQATALTSFVAALIRANSDFTPASVKDRLTASVDLSTDLAPYVKSEGALNMRKALSLYDDVLELRSQPAMFGTLKLTPFSRPLPELFCPELAGDERHVLKVSKRVDGGDASQVRLLLRNDQKEGEVKAEYCIPSAATLEFRPISGAVQTFKLADVIDFVPLSLGSAQ